MPSHASSTIQQLQFFARISSRVEPVAEDAGFRLLLQLWQPLHALHEAAVADLLTSFGFYKTASCALPCNCKPAALTKAACTRKPDHNRRCAQKLRQLFYEFFKRLRWFHDQQCPINFKTEWVADVMQRPDIGSAWLGKKGNLVWTAARDF